jgi:3-oxoadipate enol-lactonase
MLMIITLRGVIMEILFASKNSKLLGWVFSTLTLLLVGCANGPGRIGEASVATGLGVPQMFDTAVGRLAVWDTRGPNDAPTLVLWPSIFTDHSIYAPLVQRWREKYRIILIDGPGHGASGGAPGETFTMRACADAIEKILTRMGIPRAIVGGTSWGGLVAGEFALAYPERTQSLIMMNTPFFVDPKGPGMGEKFIVWGAGNILSTRLFTAGVARNFFEPETRKANGPTIQQFHSGLHQSKSGSLRASIKAVLLDRDALAPRLSKIKAPTLVVGGEHDEMYPLDQQRSAVASLPNGQLHIVRSKHISIVDQPEQVAKLIEDFLKSLKYHPSRQIGRIAYN